MSRLIQVSHSLYRRQLPSLRHLRLFSTTSSLLDLKAQTQIQTPCIPIPNPTVKSDRSQFFDSIKKELSQKLSVTSQFRNGLLMTGTVIVIGSILIWLFKDRFKDKIVVQTSEITKRSLEDNHVQEQVNHLSHEVVTKILQDEEVFKQLLNLLKKLGHDPQVTQDLSFLLTEALNDPHFKRQVIDNFLELLKDPEVQSQINSSAKNIVRDLMQDRQLRQELIVYIQDVLQDRDVHYSASDAAWQSFKLTMTPKWFQSRPPSEVQRRPSKDT